MAASATPGTVSGIAAVTRRTLAKEPGLAAVGGAGVAIGLLSLTAVAFRGSFIPPEGKMLDAATFTFGVGLFVLTVALILPLAGFSDEGRVRWRRLFYVFPVLGLVLEPLQAFRGLDPRFTEAGGTVDVVAGVTFGATAALATVLVVILGLRFFKPSVLAGDPVLRAGIRYGVVSVWWSFALGIVMSVIGGRELGDAGNLLPAHGLGVHGIQAVPAVALLLVWAGTPSMRWIHAAGTGWLVACAAAGLQGVLGLDPVAPSVMTALALAGLMLWATVGFSAVALWRTSSTPGPRRQ